MEIKLNVLCTTAAAVVLYWFGDWLVKKTRVLKRGYVPAALLGGGLFVLVNAALQAAGIMRFSASNTAQSMLLLLFFTCAGFALRVPGLKQTGKAVAGCFLLLFLLVLARNILGGATAAAAQGADSSIQWEPLGLVLGCLAGTCAAWFLMRRYGLDTNEKSSQRGHTSLPRIATIVCIILFCVFIGVIVITCLNMLTGISIPAYMGAMAAAMVFRGTTEMTDEEFPDAEAEAIGTFSLGVCVTAAIMELRLWELEAPMLVMVLQTAAILVLGATLVFRRMGGNYQAAVAAAGVVSLTMGDVGGAAANMQAVTGRHGASPGALFPVLLLGGVLMEEISTLTALVLAPVF